MGRTAGRTTLVGVLIGVAALCATVGGGVSGADVARAAETPLAPGSEAATIEFSRDGVVWQTEPPGPVFDDGWLALPGTSTTGILRVRIDRPAVMRLYVTAVDVPDAELRRATTVAAGGGAAVSVASEADCVALAAPTTLAPGVPTSVSLTLAVDPALVDGQGQRMSFSLLLAFSEPGAAGVAAGCPTGALSVGAFDRGAERMPRLAASGQESASALATLFGMGVASIAMGVGALAATGRGRRTGGEPPKPVGEPSAAR